MEAFVRRLKVSANWGDEVVMSAAIMVMALLALIPSLAAEFFRTNMLGFSESLPTTVRLISPAVLLVPYAPVDGSTGTFRWYWMTLYSLQSIAVATLLWEAERSIRRKRQWVESG